MVYCTQAEVESHTGFGYTDFMIAGQTMTSSQWATYITSVIAAATQLINRYTNRISFEENDIEEYHDGRGPTGDIRAIFPVAYSSLSYRSSQFREIDRTFLPREQPVISIDAVYVDTTPNSIPTWTKQVARSSTSEGVYHTINIGGITRVRFHSSIPGYGHGNVKIQYTAGYEDGDPVLDDIRFICLDLIASILQRKRREQESVVASFNSGTQQIAQMIAMLHQEVITDDIKIRLNAYRRTPRGNAWH